jgi:hypothetical protein
MEKNTVIDNTSNTDTAGNVVHMNIFGAVSPDTAYAVRFTPQSLEEQVSGLFTRDSKTQCFFRHLLFESSV